MYNNTSMPKEINKINGPINLVRMEGTINNIHKVIYIFMDKHIKVEDQTDCDDPENSVDVNEYFRISFQNLKNKNKTYDFYLEIFPRQLSFSNREMGYDVIPDSSRIYIDNVMKFFYDNIKFNRKTNKMSSLFENVRLHYIDIRDMLYFFLIDPLNFIEKNLEENHRCIKDMVETTISVMSEFLNNVVAILEKKNFDKVKKKQMITNPNYEIISFLQDSGTRREYLEHFIYLLNKLLNSYKYDNVKKMINDYVYNYLLVEWKKYINDLSIFYDEIKDFTKDDYNDKSLRDHLRKKFNIFFLIIFDYNARVVDLYFIRRFLDKDYVSNAIVYTGAAHSVSFIYILNSIGFKITHCANCRLSIDKLNKAVPKIQDFLTEQSIFDLLGLFIRPNNKQCTDISNFPKDFA